jgi:CreA protein
MLKYILLLLCLVTSFSEEVYRAKTGGGWFIKDTLIVNAFDDPYVSGVTCYATYYDRALNLFDSHKSSLACRQTGKVVFSSPEELKPRKAVFKQAKAIFFKQTVVDRAFDAKRGVLIYLIHSKAADEDTSAHSISVVAIRDGKYKISGE